MTYRSAKYLAFVRRHASCLAWADPMTPWPPAGDDGHGDYWYEPTVAHHVRMGNGGGMGVKPSDYRTVPLTDSEHRVLHQWGEKAFWKARNVDPDKTIIALLIHFVGRDLALPAMRKNQGDDRALLAALEEIADKIR